MTAMTQIRWTGRTFSFDFPAGLYPELIERLRGTPARVEDLLANRASVMNQRQENAWSIQEHVGHLADLDEVLFRPRVEEFVNGAESLMPADMSNRITENANHNGKPLDEVLASFRRTRRALIARLESLDPATFGRSAFHPRLKVPMRLVDLMFFQAEHDDHHLATIAERLRRG
jgi:hypothetical protein